MKKAVSFLLILSMAVLLGGCIKKYESLEISLYDKMLKKTFDLSDEQEEGVLKLWNQSKWERGLRKCGWLYEFVLDNGDVIRYNVTVPGSFSDVNGNRTLKLTKEQTLYVNAIIKEQAKVHIDPSASELNQESKKQSVSVSEEQMSELFHIWNNSEWDVIYWWPEYDYGFVLEPEVFIVYESESGIFQYDNRQLTISEEQRQQINALIEQQFAQ